MLLAAVACSDDPVSPAELLLPVAITLDPAAAGYRAGDSVRIRVAAADGALPDRIEWSVLPEGAEGAVDGAEFTYRFEVAGAHIVSVRGEFGGGRAGTATREIAVDPNTAPTVMIAPIGTWGRIPVGEEFILVAEVADDDDPAEALEIEWIDATGPVPESIGAGDTLRLTPTAVGLRHLAARVTDPHGASGVRWIEIRVYDPITPAEWQYGLYGERVWRSLTLRPDGVIVAHDGPSSGADCGCAIVALDPAGAELWRFETEGAAAPIPAGPANELILTRSDLAELGPNGAVTWSRTAEEIGDTGLPAAVLPDGTILQPVRRGTAYHLLRISGGVVGPLSAELPGLDAYPFLAEPDGRTYVAGSGPDFTRLLLAMDAEGDTAWTISVNGRPAVHLAAGPAGRVLFVAGDSLLSVADGSVEWGIEVAGTTAVAAGESAIFVTSDYGLAAIDPADGSILWTADVDGRLGLPVLAADGTIYVAAGSRVIGLDGTSGAVVWEHVTSGGIDSLLLTPDGRLVVADGGGFIKAFDVGAGPAAGPWPMAGGGPARRNVRGGA